MSLSLIEKAREEDITILKLLPQVINMVQPLMFGVLGCWKELRHERINVRP